MRFDAIAIDRTAELGQIVARPEDSPERFLEKIVYGATKANIASVWTDGTQRVATAQR